MPLGGGILDRLALEQDVEQALEVVDDLLLFAYRLDVRAGGDVVADAGDLAQDAGALEVGEPFAQQLHLFGLLLTLVALLQAFHQALQPLGLAEDLVLVAP